jgi:uncharacterized membrane protein
MISEPDIRGNRLLFLDIARSVALCGMIVFHSVRDMEFFGLIERGTTLTGGWAAFARGIAASFLFLSGMSLVLAHAHGFRTRAWSRRFIRVAAAACLVTLATYIAFPSQFIYFGILHALALAAVLGVPFLFMPAWAALVGVAAIMLAFLTLSRSVFSSPSMAWTGLGMDVPASMDFIPVVPWLAPFLLGMALARLVSPERFEPRWPRRFPARLLAWPGQHSLAVYLLHQPVLLALVWTVAKVTQ